MTQGFSRRSSIFSTESHSSPESTCRRPERHLSTQSAPRHRPMGKARRLHPTGCHAGSALSDPGAGALRPGHQPLLYPWRRCSWSAGPQRAGAGHYPSPSPCPILALCWPISTLTDPCALKVCGPSDNEAQRPSPATGFSALRQEPHFHWHDPESPPRPRLSPTLSPQASGPWEPLCVSPVSILQRSFSFISGPSLSPHYLTLLLLLAPT